MRCACPIPAESDLHRVSRASQCKADGLRHLQQRELAEGALVVVRIDAPLAADVHVNGALDERCSLHRGVA